MAENRNFDGTVNAKSFICYCFFHFSGAVFHINIFWNSIKTYFVTVLHIKHILNSIETYLGSDFHMKHILELHKNYVYKARRKSETGKTERVAVCAE